MKMRLLAATLFASAALGVTAHAAVGDVIGEVYSTDIVTTLNGVEIPSVNIGGTTMIALRDLEYFDFSIWFSEETKSAIARGPEWMLGYEGKEPRPAEHYDTVGEIIGSVYETDITAYVNGFEIPSVNISGTTMVAVRDLGDMTDSMFSEIGFSKYGFSYEWDEENRRVIMERFPKNNLFDLSAFTGDTGLTFVIADDTLSLEPAADDYRLQKLIYDDTGISFINNSTGEADGRCIDIYYTDENGEKTKVGIQYQPYEVAVTDDGYGNVAVEKEVDGIWQICLDDTLLTEIMNKAEKPEPLTREEIVNIFDNNWNMFRVYGKFETDDYTVIAAAQTGLTHGGWYYAVFRIDSDGNAEQVQNLSSVNDGDAFPSDWSFEDGVLTYTENDTVKQLNVLTGEVTE